MPRLKKDILNLFLHLTLYTVFGMMVACQPGKQKEQLAKPVSKKAEFTGSRSCQTCHTRQYQDWLQSDHFLAMQEARDSTVMGDFNNRTYSADGITSRFFKKEGKFFINTQGEDGQNHDYQVLYTFGYFPLQQYLIAFPGGRMQATRASWDSRNKKWFHQNAGQKIHPRDWLHWTGNGQNWNTMCATCHSTNLQKNYDFTTDAYQTKWAEINVTCESCHGPGSKHIALATSGDYSKGNGNPGGLHYGTDTIPVQQLNTCAPCHARKADILQNTTGTGELMDTMIPQLISNEFYFADGQIREEDYEFGSFAQSKMFHNNVRCSNCHNPHSGKIMKTGNDLCMSCHQPKYNTKEHHFHTINTEGAQCISCHMPSRTYMGNDNRRDHSFRVPRPDQSVQYGTPNTCNSCHKEKSPAWAAAAISKWYGPMRAHHFSDDLLPGSLLTPKSEDHLIRLLKDSKQPAIARATAAHYLGDLITERSAQSLVAALMDPQPIVRYYTLRALEKFSPEIWLGPAAGALTDSVRSVRIAAADLLHKLPPTSIPPTAVNAFQKADEENRKYLNYQTDFAVGNVMLADYELQGSDHINAILHYMRGLKKDSLMNYARLNLSAAYNSVGKNQEALQTLKDAALIDPSNDRTFYNLGLLYYEMKDIPSAISSFSRAATLGSDNPGLYYNYGLLLQQQGNARESEKVLLRGFTLDPRAANINYALSYLYIQQKDLRSAKKHARILRQTDPQNPEYQALFRSLGI